MESSIKYKPETATSSRKYCFVTFTLFLFLSFTVSIALGNDSPLPSHPAKKENSGTGGKMVNRIVTEEDNGREIEIGVGEIIRVDLRFHGSAGYSWYPDLPGDGSMQLIDSRSVDLSEEGMVGGPAIGMWYFKALAPGNFTLTLLHYRVWEGRSKATKTFSVKLRVIDKRRGK